MAVPVLICKVFASGGGELTESSEGKNWVAFYRAPSSFQQLSVRFRDQNPNLDFEYSCRYPNQDDVLHSGAGRGGNPVPGSPEQARYLQSFSVRLIGKDAPKYTVTYQAKITRHHPDTGEDEQPNTEYEGRDGSMCGEPEFVPGVRVWLNFLSIRCAER